MTDVEINESVGRLLYTQKDGGWQLDHSYGYDWHRYLPIRNFTTDIKEAWEIAQWLVDHGYHVNLWRLKKDSPWAFAYSIRLYTRDAEGHIAFADTAPMAICRAFLKLEDL